MRDHSLVIREVAADPLGGSASNRFDVLPEPPDDDRGLTGRLEGCMPHGAGEEAVPDPGAEVPLDRRGFPLDRSNDREVEPALDDPAGVLVPRVREIDEPGARHRECRSTSRA